MPLRRLINLVYAALARGKDEDELARFDAELEAEPGKKKARPHMAPRSRGVDQLMAAAGLPQMGPPPRRPRPEGSPS